VTCPHVARWTQSDKTKKTNPEGDQFDLGRAGAFRGFRILFGIMVTAKDVAATDPVATVEVP
jgi:hypothetical protein